MKKIDIISITNLKDTNGVSTFVRTILSLNSKFNSYGIAISSNHCFQGPDAKKMGASEGKLDTDIRPYRKKILDGMSFNQFGALVIIFWVYMRRAFLVAKKYSEHPKGDVAFYQDIFSFFIAHYVFRIRIKSVTILHSADHALDSIYIMFPGAKKGITKVFLEYIFDYTLVNSTAIVTLSKKYNLTLLEKYIKLNIHCIYNTPALDVDIVENRKISSSTIKLICVGSLQFRKGYDILIDAVSMMAPLLRSRLNISIAGGGSDLQFLKEKIFDNKLSEIIHLLGVRSDINKLLSNSDIFCMPSRIEGLSIAMLEAMQMGLPILTTPVGSISEIMDSNDCMFFEVDSKSLKNTLDKICLNDMDLNELSKASIRVFKEKVSNEVFVNAYSDLFNQIE